MRTHVAYLLTAEGKASERCVRMEHMREIGANLSKNSIEVYVVCDEVCERKVCFLGYSSELVHSR